MYWVFRERRKAKDEERERSQESVSGMGSKLMGGGRWAVSEESVSGGKSIFANDQRPTTDDSVSGARVFLHTTCDIRQNAGVGIWWQGYFCQR